MRLSREPDSFSFLQFFLLSFNENNSVVVRFPLLFYLFSIKSRDDVYKNEQIILVFLLRFCFFVVA